MWRNCDICAVRRNVYGLVRGTGLPQTLFRVGLGRRSRKHPAAKDPHEPSPSRFPSLLPQYRQRSKIRADGRCRPWCVRVFEVPYRLLVETRNRHYDRAADAAKRVPVPVVSVGNLTTGGTGKTPMVAWLARWFQQRGLRPVIVSRGYGSQNGQPNDEARELAEQLPDVPHLQDADRVRGAQQAIAQHGAQVILLDDGFQHRRLHRDLDIVLVDALQPFGSEHLLPRGLLRSPSVHWAAPTW